MVLGYEIFCNGNVALWIFFLTICWGMKPKRLTKETSETKFGDFENAKIVLTGKFSLTTQSVNSFNHLLSIDL